MTNLTKRLAIVMPTFFEQVIGGSEYQAYLLADEAKRRGLEVHYIFTSESDSYPNHLDLRLHTIKRVRLSKRYGATWNLYFLAVHRFLNQIRPDVVYVRGGWSFAGMTAYFSRIHGCKSVWHVASSADVTPPPLLPQLIRPLNLIERKAIDYAIRHSTHVVAHAQFQAALLKQHYGREAVVILKEQPEPMEKLDKSGPLTVVWVANIKPLKQPEMFVRLAGEFRADEHVRFVMIGRPAGAKYQEHLEARMAALPNLEYRGERTIEEVNELLAKSHVFVNTSTYEGLPNTFVQSWMREVPVVSMLLDPDDILTTRKIGFFSGSFAQMVCDVRKLISGPSLRDEMGQRAREYALEHHSLKKNMGRLLDLIMS